MRILSFHVAMGLSTRDGGRVQVQHACLPQAMLGTDVLCQARWAWRGQNLARADRVMMVMFAKLHSPP